MTGPEAMPQMLIDESSLVPERFQRVPFPAKLWAQEKACLAGLGKNTNRVGAPPDILVIPSVRTIRVRDMTVDSMLYAEDSTFAGEHWSSPTIGYSLVRSNVILMIAPVADNPYVLRHEALHFMLWRQGLVPLGHPKEYFLPCDAEFNPK